MWDLDTLRYLNEQAHLRAVARAQEASQSHAPDAPTAPVYPLANLARCLLAGPPSIAYILQLLENSEVVVAFMELVSEYLPERENEIRTADVDDRIRLFSHYFGQRYFPLSDSLSLDDSTLEDFIREIPVDLMGFSYEDYHEFSDFRTGYILLLSLIEDPYGDSEGGRVPIIAYVSDLLGGDVAGLIPANGWTPEQLHELTDRTKFEGVGAFADWVHSQTDYWLLDANYDEYVGESWQPNSVAALTEQWPVVRQIQDQMARVVEFIEENPKKSFLELLNILLDVNTSEFVVPDEQLPLPLFGNA